MKKPKELCVPQAAFVTLARKYAIEVHAKINQMYGDKPYTYHLDCVHNRVTEFRDDLIDYIVKETYDEPDYVVPVVEAAAFLHDSMEDAHQTWNDIKGRMDNEDVANVVLFVSSPHGKDRVVKTLLSCAKIREDYRAIYLKLCDRYANSYESKATGNSMFKKNKSEYPILKYALQKPGMFPILWKALDELYYK